MTDLATLLDTWQQWSAHDVMTRALGQASTEDSAVRALDALRDSHELVELLTGWQWQAVYASRLEGASWGDVGTAIGTTAEAAEIAYVSALDRLEQLTRRKVSVYRKVLLS